MGQMPGATLKFQCPWNLPGFISRDSFQEELGTFHSFFTIPKVLPPTLPVKGDLSKGQGDVAV